MSPATLPAGHFAAASFTGHFFSLIAHSRIVYQIEHSAPVQAVMSALAAALAASIFNLVLNRQRLSWRVYSDEPLDPIPAQAQRIRKFVTFEIYLRDSSHADDGAGADRGRPVGQPGIVLIRVRNSGLVTLKGKKHLTVPLTFCFPGREVLGALVDELERGYAEVVEQPVKLETPALNWWQWLRKELTFRKKRPAAQLAAGATAAPGAASRKGNKPVDCVQLDQDTFKLRRKGRFTLMVILSGTQPRDPNTPKDVLRQKMPIELKSDLLDGEVDEEDPRGGPRARSLVVAGLTGLLLAGLILGLLLSPAPPPAHASACTGGSLKLIGSTAFSPVVQKIAGTYRQGCPSAHISVPATNRGSGIGLQQLLAAGADGKAAGLIVMSDGPAPATDSKLSGRPVAIIIYTMIVNNAVPFNDLTTSDIRGIFNGTKTNWDQIRGPAGQPGPNLPIKIISREPGSGSRNTFDQYVLALPPTTASRASCTSDVAARIAGGVDCVKSTDGMLQAVSAIQGAIGYAQIGDVAGFRGGGIQATAIDRLGGRYGDIGRPTGSYAFWTVEYLYTYGPATGLAKAFLGYLHTPTAVSDLEAADAQYTPCPATGSGRARALCAQAGS